MSSKAVKAPNVSGVNSHLGNEGQTSVLGHFTSFYDKQADQRSKEREESAPLIAQSFYQLVTDFYEYGYGESFHFSPIYDNLSMTENLHQYEIEIAKTLRAKPGMTILVSTRVHKIIIIMIIACSVSQLLCMKMLLSFFMYIGHWLWCWWTCTDHWQIQWSQYYRPQHQ